MANSTKYVLAFDSGAKGTRYIDNYGDYANGCMYAADAKEFDSEIEAKEYNDAKGYVCWVEETD